MSVSGVESPNPDTDLDMQSHSAKQATITAPVDLLAIALLIKPRMHLDLTVRGHRSLLVNTLPTRMPMSFSAELFPFSQAPKLYYCMGLLQPDGASPGCQIPF